MVTEYSFPHRLKALREEIGLNQTEFAAALGISRASLSYYETDSRVPDIKFLQELHEKTGCSIEFLLGYVDNMKPSNEHLGLSTGLSDRAIDALSELDFFSETVDGLISHPLFSHFIRALNVAMETKTDSTDLFEFSLFKAVAILRNIVIDNARDSSDIGALYERDFASANEDFEEAGQLLEVAGLAEKWRKETRRKYLEHKAQQSEDAKTDPILRFRLRMEDEACYGDQEK